MKHNPIATPQAEPKTVALVSDTHGLLRPEVLPILAGVAHIIHAGDVGDPHILDQLAAIAPVTAVRGNIDVSGPTAELPATEVLDLDGILFYIVHRLQDLDLNPAVAGVSVVVSGHTHRHDTHWKDGVLYINPGSIGPRRFRLPVTLARIQITGKDVVPELITLS